jgi:hypothetical protein
MRKLGCAIALLCAVLAIWSKVTRPYLAVRPATNADAFENVRYRVAGVVQPLLRARNVCVVEGDFRLSTRMWLRLYEVSARGSQEISRFRFRLWRSDVLLPFGERRDSIHVALCESGADRGRSISLGLRGLPGRPEKAGSVRVKGDLANHATFRGTLPRGREVILHIAGDTAFQWDPNGTVAEFAERNPGSFLVVTAFHE